MVRRIVLPVVVAIALALSGCTPQGSPSTTGAGTHPTTAPSTSPDGGSVASQRPTTPPTDSSSPSTGTKEIAEACAALQRQFHTSGSNAEETIELAKTEGATAQTLATSAQAASGRLSDASDAVVRASQNFDSYLKTNDSATLRVLESAAEDAGRQCRIYGVTVVLDQ